MSSEPTVYIGVPTGDVKEYALLYMLAAVRDLDYPPDRLSFNISVTDLGRLRDALFIRRVKALVANANFPFTTSVHTTHPTVEDMKRWGGYYAVIMNIHKLRIHFLRGDADRFWLLGGDNPPPRRCLRQLLEVDADVASAMMKQRPSKVFEEQMKGFNVDPAKIYGIYWHYLWTLDDVSPDLEPKLRDALRTAWLEHIFLRPYAQPQGESVDVVRNVVFGSGCSLIKRRVFEHFGYNLGKGGTHSEDLHFANMVNLRGWDTAIRLDAPCMHFDVDGKCFI